jgi:hypothetical protein
MKWVTHMKNIGIWLVLVVSLAVFVIDHHVWAFSFSESEKQEAQREAEERAEKAEAIRYLKSIPCKAEIKKKKIAVIIGERHSDGGFVYDQGNYGLLFQEINKRLREIGLTTYTQDEIRAQIAQAEIKAFMSNDMDAAIAAASRLKAHFIIRGMIHSRTQINPVANVNEVFVDMGFTLLNARGLTISDVTAKGDAFSGSDTLSVALDLVRENADYVVAKLYHDYCLWRKNQ